MIFDTKHSLEKRLNQLYFMKMIKKDYYKCYPNIHTYREICELISQINYIKQKMEN